MIAGTGLVIERLRVHEISAGKGQRLLRIVRRGTGSAVTWRRAQMVPLSAHGMDTPGSRRCVHQDDLNLDNER